MLKEWYNRHVLALIESHHQTLQNIYGMNVYIQHSASTSFYTAEISTVQCYTRHKGQNQLQVKKEFILLKYMKLVS